MQEQVQCQSDLTMKYRSDLDQCCSIAKEDFLTPFQLVSSENVQCSISHSVFNNPDNFTMGNLSLSTSNIEYIIPSFTFNCSGCIEKIEILTQNDGAAFAERETLDIKLWNTFLNSRDGAELYEERGKFTIEAMPETTAVSNDFVRVSLSAFGPVCFQAGDVFGFSLPPTSNIQMIVAAQGVGEAYSVDSDRPPYCEELNSLFEPVPGSEVDGNPQIALQITSMGLSTTRTSITPSVTIQHHSSSGMISTPTPEVIVEMGSGSAPSPMPGTSSSSSDTLIYAIAGVVGGVLFIFVATLVVLNVIFFKKWRQAKQSVLKRIRSRKSRPSTQSMQYNQVYNSTEVLDRPSVNVISPGYDVSPGYDMDDVFSPASRKSVHIYEELPSPKNHNAEVPAPARTYAKMPVPVGTYTEVPVPAVTYTEVPVPSVTYAEVPVPSVTYAEVPVPAGTYAEVPVPSVTYAEVPVPSVTYAEVPVPESAINDTRTEP